MCALPCFAVRDVAAGLGHLEPFEIALALGRRADRVVDGLRDSFRRTADHMGHSIYVVGHACLRRSRRSSAVQCRAGAYGSERSRVATKKGTPKRRTR